MSNKTQLQTNNTALDGYIARINAAKDVAASLPEAGSGGSDGGSVETCTVTLYSETGEILVVGTQVNADGSFIAICYPLGSSTEYTYTFLKNSVLTLISENWGTNFDNSLTYNGYDVIARELQDGVVCLHLTGDAASISLLAY